MSARVRRAGYRRERRRVLADAGGPVVFAPFKADTDYFSGDKAYMLNLRVANIAQLIEQLSAAGIAVETRDEWNHPDYGPSPASRTRKETRSNCGSRRASRPRADASALSLTQAGVGADDRNRHESDCRQRRGGAAGEVSAPLELARRHRAHAR